ncbi:hypothetical protein BDZ45DRAFT_743524 [Acephala macrosclerotiorum]|nr:hypothetical protein BDZ45DRAFT_743524 [Acephala macrosclerotiorum]
MNGMGSNTVADMPNGIRPSTASPGKLLGRSAAKCRHSTHIQRRQTTNGLTVRGVADLLESREDSTKISELVDALASARQEIDAKSAQLRGLEEMLQKERQAREPAEEGAKRLELQTRKHLIRRGFGESRGDGVSGLQAASGDLNAGPKMYIQRRSRRIFLAIMWAGFLLES